MKAFLNRCLLLLNTSAFLQVSNNSVQCGVVTESAISINECDNKIYQLLTDALFNLE